MILLRLREILSRLHTLHPADIDLSLGRLRCLLQDLGNPHLTLPPVLHCAGTNGKGSTLAFLRVMLETAGYRVHLYTSPHLVHFKERIRLAGTFIEETFLEECLLECEKVNRGREITFFEITTAAAFLAFSRVPADILLLETGLGGAKDATNVVEKPILTLITPIAQDHQQFLGNTIEDIAIQKAGILKPGVPCVSAPQLPAVKRILAKEAMRNKTFLFDHWHISEKEDAIFYSSDRKSYLLPRPALSGLHQIQNMGTALACLENLPSFSVSFADIKKAVRSVKWPGRLQRLSLQSLPCNVPKEWEVWLDIGHNESAAQALSVQIRKWKKEEAKEIVCIFGMRKDKDPKLFFTALRQDSSIMRVVSLKRDDESEKREVFSAEELLAIGLDLKIPNIKSAPSVSQALQDLQEEFYDRPLRILVCGSFSVAADFKDLEDYF